MGLRKEALETKLCRPGRLLRIKRFILDGEIAALDERGRHFALLQSIKTSKAPSGHARIAISVGTITHP